MILPTAARSTSIKTMEESIRDFKWLFSAEELRDTPSARLGVSAEKELFFRQKEAMLIQAIGAKARLTQLAVGTSVIFMHRFFMYRSIQYYPRVQLAIALALAGGKVEESENARKLEHLIRATLEIIYPTKMHTDPFLYENDPQLKRKIITLKEGNCNTDSNEYRELRKIILECETEIYSVIGFQLQIVHPHNFVLRICSLLGADNIKDITQYAYNLATACSQLTMLCLKYKPEMIATMCLNVALKANGVQLQAVKDGKLKWYQIYDPNTDYTLVEAMSEEFLYLLKSCSLLSSWMKMLLMVEKRDHPRLHRIPGAYHPSRPRPQQAGKTAPSGAHVPHGQRNRHSGSFTGSESTSVSQHRLSSGGGSRTQYMSSSSRQQQQQQHAHQKPPVSRSGVPSEGGSSRPTQSGSSCQAPPSSGRTSQQDKHHNHQQHFSIGGSGDMQRHAEGRGSGSSQQPHASQGQSLRSEQGQRPRQEYASGGSDQGRSRSQEGSTRYQHRQSSGMQELSHPSVRQTSNNPPLLCRTPKEDPPASPPQTQHTAGVEGASSSNNAFYSPVAVRPPSPSYTPPADLDNEGIVIPPLPPTKLSPPDFSDGNSSGFPSVPGGGSGAGSGGGPGSKLSLSDYLKRAATAKPKDRNTLHAGPSVVKESSQDAWLQREETPMDLDDDEENPETDDRPPTLALFDAGSGSFPKPEVSPSGNPRIKMKFKRDPGSGEQRDVSPSFKIITKPQRTEPGNTSAEKIPSDRGTPCEEGEILEDSSSPASSTSTERRSEGLKMRLSIPKSSSSGRKDSDEYWSSNRGGSSRGGERESGHRSHHHHHHHHRHKSKKHKEHRSSRHEGKHSSTSSSFKRSNSNSSYEDYQQTKSYRQSSDSNLYHSGGQSTAPPPLQPPPPPPGLLQTSSGFGSFSSSSLPGSMDTLTPDIGVEGSNHPPPHWTTTPDVATPPHHEHFHRIMEQHRASMAANKPPLPPPVPPPPPPPPPPKM